MTTILAGDIGGTSARLACFELIDGRLNRKISKKYPSRTYQGLEEIVRVFIEEHRVAITHAAFGIAGPVQSGRVVMPNLSWVVEQAGLAHALGIDAVWLINDLEASAYGIALLGPEDFALLNAGVADARGNIAMISAGTGLGEAGAVWNGKRLLPFACEGSHSDFAPRDDLEAELLLHLRKRFGHVSWERVVSGPGLCNLYEFLRETGRGVEDSWVRGQLQGGDPAAVISRAALAGRCALCVRALDLFVSLYAAEAGNLALKVMATGGVYLGGGIAPKIVEKLMAPGFMQSFSDKGRMRKLLEAMAVRVVLNDETALLGAARFAAVRAGLPDPVAFTTGAPQPDSHRKIHT